MYVHDDQWWSLPNTSHRQKAEGEAADPELQALLSELEAGENGGATIEKIQQKFLQRTLGGA